MALQHQLNLLDGERRPALGGGRFEIPAPGRGGSPVGGWPRSGAEDVEAALGSLAVGGPPWARRDGAQRAAILSRATAILAADPDPEGTIAATLGLEPSRLRGHPGLAPPPPADFASAVGSGIPGGQRPGVSLVRRHWSELQTGAARALFVELAAGRTVLLLGDRRLPALADRLAGALVEAGLPPGVLALLHDDGEGALRSALASGRVTRLVASGHGDHEQELRRLVERCVGAQAFGAGVVEMPRSELEFRRLERGCERVGADEDPREAARRVALQAFDPVRTISGQLPNQTGVVVVDRRSFSPFTEALLESLEERRAVDPALPFMEPDLDAYLAGIRDLGLDEGATLIHEGTASPSRSRGLNARLTRLVFTNVESHMRLLEGSRPAPVLLLMRSDSPRN